MKNVKVRYIFEKDRFIHIVLDNNENYEMVYRAAKGVYWDKQTASLYYKGKVTAEDAILFICQAMKIEYDVNIIFE